jgi:septal ring factor EnvC (AmiA/AmiB activator)
MADRSRPAELSLRTWALLVLLGIAAAVLSTALSYRQWGYKTAEVPLIVGRVDERIASFQQHEDQSVKELRDLYTEARRQVEDVRQEQNQLRENVAHAAGQIEAERRARRDTGARLTTIEQTLKSAKKTVERTNQAVERAIPPPTSWWRRLLP